MKRRRGLMQVSDKLIKPLTEAKYLNADNVSRYRCIMRIFFEHYEKLKYWLYQEEVYEEMIKDPFFADYRPEQCQQDLTMLTEWKSLVPETALIMFSSPEIYPVSRDSACSKSHSAIKNPASAQRVDLTSFPLGIF